MTDRAMACVLSALELELDVSNPEEQRRYHEWKAWGETGTILKAPFGNWHFGSFLQHAVRVVTHAFLESERKRLVWLALPHDIRGEAFRIEATAKRIPDDRHIH